MLQSKLNNQVQYKEKRTIDAEDIGHESAVYSLDYFKHPIVVVLGKNNFTFINRGIVFYPVYIVDKDDIRSQIGVLEVPKKDALKILDADGDVLLSKLDLPLFYSFVNQTYIDQAMSDVEMYLRYAKDSRKNAESVEMREMELLQKELTEDITPLEQEEDSVLSLSIPKNGFSSEVLNRAQEMLKNGIFEPDSSTNPPPTLVEETEAIAKEIKSGFQDSAKTNWVQDFMRNPNYSIHEVEANGDCFFAVVRDAFAQIGQKTTVHRLRAALAAEVTDDVFQENRKLYLVNLSKKNEYQETIQRSTRLLANLKQRLTRTKSNFNKDESDAILKEATRQKEIIAESKIFLKEVQDLEDHFIGFMRDIDSLDRFREYIQTSGYWADTWAISTLEHLLNVKFVILSEKAFKEGAQPSVMNCGEVNLNIERKGAFAPNNYIMTTYSGDHYRLITYKNKRIFTFPEVPYDVKVLITNKCIERNGGVYYYIQDFRNFKTRLGIDVEAIHPKNRAETDVVSDLFDPSIVFMFYSKSQRSAKPGKGTHEKIGADRVGEFVPLATIADWRRKLDDEWVRSDGEALFSLDGYKWASVEHYYQAAKFRKRNPAFTKEFALDSNSEISKSVVLAKAAGSKSGKIGKTKEHEGGVLRPKTVSIDPDFYEDERNLKERAAAVKSKFAQNAEMARVLKLTSPARLTQYVHADEPAEDTILMQVRQEIM
jgi:hypothetical protein